MKKFRLIVCFFFFSSCHFLIAQRTFDPMVRIIIGPDHTNWVYKRGEKVQFLVTVMEFGNPLKNVPVYYEVGPERMKPVKKDSLELAKGVINIDGGTMEVPGFLRCRVVAKVDGKEYEGMATAGFDPLDIKPTIENPSDFSAFWDHAKEELEKIPIDARIVLMPSRCTEKVNVYQVNMQNYPANTRLYGMLCVPKKEGKYPALLSVPGAGVYPYEGNIAMAEKGLITLEIGIHGIPLDMNPVVYDNLGWGALRDYMNFNLDDRDHFYYKHVYLGCVRAVDFIFSLPQFDGINIGVEGGSQGGALSIITAGLDSRIKCLAVYFPALCDLTGALKGRAGGWPHYFEGNKLRFNNKKDKIETCGYYDVVNFARLLKVPGMYTWGYNDDTCPPTSMYAAYNVITAPKDLYLALETGHWEYPEQNEKLNNWLVRKLRPSP
ncbi:MAG TPA: acetylxylan esterase [Puia sp.]|jgi:cephalosporin-C deacetylase-like acetyl esterase